MEFSWLIILAVLGVLPFSHAAKDPARDFCRRWGHSSAVVDRKLYIDGGYLNWNPLPDNPVNQTSSYLVYSDLNTISNDMPAQYFNLSKDGSIPDLIGGCLWGDNLNKVVYQFGGEFDTTAPDTTFWAYDILLNQWNETKAQRDLLRPSWGASAVADDLGYGYYLGGWLSNNSVPGWSGGRQALNTMVRFDMNTGIWYNMSGPDPTGRAEGVMVYLPASDSGLLIYFGGVATPLGGPATVGVNMSMIYIHDIASSKWYTQTATGDIPGMRSRFCAGATWAEDKSSYNIYLYGGAGTNPNNSIGYDDVYILTIPTFQWIKWYPTEPGVGSPHHSLTCNVIDGAQMLIIGGTFPSPNDRDLCDTPGQLGQHNLVLGQNGPQNSSWDIFTPGLTQYVVPIDIVGKIGGSAGGGAQQHKPATWDNRDLPVYFSRIPKFPTRTPTRSIPTATHSSNPKPSNKPSNKPKTAIIVGSIVGGVGGLIVLLILGCCCFRLRKRRPNRQAGLAELSAVHELSEHQPHDKPSISASHVSVEHSQPRSPHGSLPSTHPNSAAQSPMQHLPPLPVQQRTYPLASQYPPQTPTSVHEVHLIYPYNATSPAPISPPAAQPVPQPYNPVYDPMHHQQFQPPPTPSPVVTTPSEVSAPDMGAQVEGSGGDRRYSYSTTPANMKPKHLTVRKFN